jgi:hypothetical protein|tara:strand:- start:277 stop:390 length:114 start_codon:yes stop_codon:yes gene_type:complete
LLFSGVVVVLRLLLKKKVKKSARERDKRVLKRVTLFI